MLLQGVATQDVDLNATLLLLNRKRNRKGGCHPQRRATLPNTTRLRRQEATLCPMVDRMTVA